MKQKLIIVMLLLISITSCILVPYIPPKPNKFQLYKRNVHGVFNDAPIKTNGFYYFYYIDTVVRKGELFSGYYRFTNEGKLRLIYGLTGKVDPEQMYVRRKSIIQKDLDKHYWGYYSANRLRITFEYITEVPENLTSIFYDSKGVLSYEGDTLFVESQYNRKLKRTEQLNRTCVFYEFPD